MKKLIILLIVIATFTPAKILEVPSQFSSIQTAINASQNGDTVLVAAGTYFENINYNGKNILVTSHFLYNNDLTFITSTVINGNKPAHPDTASCVLIKSGEDSTAILQGFTITGGTGTSWRDEHGAGVYTEGGGILVALSSPTIRYNIITGNSAVKRPNKGQSAGGGGIRCGDGNPKILNNIISNNSGMYGGGIVMNYCDGEIKNNLVINNRVYQAVTNSLV